MAEKKEMEMQERASELNALGYNDTDPEGLNKLKEGEEFDDITRELRQKTNFAGGKYRVKDQSDSGELA